MLDTDIIPTKLNTYYATWANRPTSDIKAGDLFYATDRKVLYRYNGSTWDGMTVYSASGLNSAKPSAADLPDGSLYYATDTATLYQVAAAAWVSITSSPVTFCDTEVYANVPPTTYTDLDLSGTVGANRALVLIEITQNSASVQYHSFRTNGKTKTENAIDYMESVFKGTTLNNLSSAHVWVKTDANGVVEWTCASAAYFEWLKVVAYAK